MMDCWRRCATAAPRRATNTTSRLARPLFPHMAPLALAEWGNRHFAPEGRQMQLVEIATQRHVEPSHGG